MFKPTAKIIADSVNENGDRLTTFFESKCKMFCPCVPPVCAGIYICLDKNNAVLYVGQSKNIRKRFGSHSRLKEIEKMGFKHLAVIECDQSADLDEIEAKTIYELNPILNIMPVRGYGKSYGWRKV